LYKKTRGRSRNTRSGVYLIGEVSKKVNLSQKTIREYEKIGLIKPTREARTNNRVYSDFEIAQIQHITRLIHNEGFTLPCIKRILELAPCWNIFDCKVKEICPAYQHAPNPCYETRNHWGTLCSGSCDECVIFINRSLSGSKILNGPYRHHVGHVE
jgi:hypothetical protein